jgi:hypothetical protein
MGKGKVFGDEKGNEIGITSYLVLRYEHLCIAHSIG